MGSLVRARSSATSLILLPASFNTSTASGKLSHNSISSAQLLIKARHISTKNRGPAPPGPGGQDKVGGMEEAVELEEDEECTITTLFPPSPSASTNASMNRTSHTLTVASAGKQLRKMHSIQRGRNSDAMSGKPRLRDTWAAKDTRRWFMRRDTTWEST